MPGIYTINYSDPSKPAFTISPQSTNTDTSLKMVGYRSSAYGEILWTDLLHLLEHFASPNPPNRPTVGQLWLNTSVDPGALNYFGTDADWHLVGDGSTMGGSTIGVRPTEPRIGMIWYDSEVTGRGYVWTGLEWVDLSPGATGPAGPAGAPGPQGAAGPTVVSEDNGNLLQVRQDGLYYGAEAPTDVGTMYVNNVTGVDTAAGTKANPVKTIQEALSRGPGNIDRTIELYQGQVHLVDPAKPAILRGGRLNILPYGPSVDAIANVQGNSKYSTLTCLNLNTTIKALDHANYGQTLAEGGSGIYQNGLALLADNAKIWVQGLTMIAGSENTSGIPQSRQRGSFSSYMANSDWVLYNVRVSMPTTSSYMFDDALFCRLNITLYLGYLSGPGYFGIAGSKTMSITAESLDISQAAFIAKIAGAASNPYLYTNFTTNLSP